MKNLQNKMKFERNRIIIITESKILKNGIIIRLAPTLNFSTLERATSYNLPRLGKFCSQKSENSQK